MIHATLHALAIVAKIVVALYALALASTTIWAFTAGARRRRKDDHPWQ